MLASYSNEIKKQANIDNIKIHVSKIILDN